MRKAFRHTGVLMMLGVVALGLIGAAYTLWYQNLSVTTTINTGTLAANWSFHPWSAGTSGEGTFGATSTSGLGKPVVALITSADNVGVNASASQILGQGGTGSGSARFTYGNFNPPTNVGSPTPVKPVPTCEGALSPTDSGATSLTLTIGGLFPFAGCEFQIDIHSSGTVPFHLAVQSQTVKQCDADGNNCNTVIPNTENLPWTRGVVDTGDPDNYAQCLALFNADWKGPIPGQINVGNTTTGAPVQIHPNQDLTCTFMLVLDENWNKGTGSAPSYVSDQNLAFQVTTNYTAYQWNESPSASTLSSIAP